MRSTCKSIGCGNAVVGDDFCQPCSNKEESPAYGGSLADTNPEQYKSLGDLTEVDAFAVLHLFQVQDPSGCLQHTIRTLLIGGQPVYRDVRQARDTLTRWLQLNPELVQP